MNARHAAPAAVELHIEELILEGFAPGDRYRIAEALERELSQLLAECGAPAGLTQGGDMPSLDGGSFKVVRGAAPAEVGAQVARAIYGGLSHGRDSAREG